MRDQLPEKIKNNKYERGIVVAVDYRTETVTVDCGSIIEYGVNEIIYLVFELISKMFLLHLIIIPILTSPIVTMITTRMLK